MLRKYRLENRYRLEDMANMLNIKKDTYNGYEKRKRKTPLEVLVKFLEIRQEENDDIAIKVLKEFLDK